MDRLSNLLSDVRFAIRLLARAPLFTVTLLGVLASGIGATTAMFSIVESVLLRPLPYPHPEELTMLWKTHEPLAREWPASIPDLQDWQKENKTFSSIAASSYDAFSLSSDGKPAEYLGGADVSGDFFTMLGVRALHGRLLGPDDDRLEAPRVCVLSAEVWHRRFGSDPALVGKTVTLNAQAYTVVGIAAEGFRFSGPRGDRADAWVPLARGEDYARRAASRGNNFLRVMGRRKPGVTIAQAQADMTAVVKSLEARYPETLAHRGVNVVDLHEALVGSAKEDILVLLGAVALVFLVVCANVASLLLARGATRRGEMAARAALGATRGRLVAQLVTEAVVVFLLGGATGAVLALFLVDFFATSIAGQIWSSNIAIRVDAVALGFTLVVSLLCGLVFGVAPALATSRVEPQAVLKETAAQAGVSRSQRLLRSALVVAQVAVACALLVGGGLALRAFAAIARTPPGFDAEGLAMARTALPEAKYADDDRIVAFYDRLLARVAAEPGVESAAANNALPMGGSNSNGWFKIEGRPPWRAGEGPILERNVITPGYFQTMRIPILRGRGFTDADRKDARQVVVISQEAAARFFPNEDPIGHRIDLQDRKGDDDWREIVGVVGDVRHSGLATPIVAESYVPLTQHPNRWMTLAVRSSRPEATLAEMRRVVEELDPELSLYGRQLMKHKIAESIEQQRFVTTLLGVFALAALVLSTMGLYGLVSYSTSQRTRELGLRMALGASPSGVVALVVRGGARLVGAGLVLGLAAAVVVGRTIAAHVSGAHGFDPLVFASIPLVLGLAGIASCVVPAWRAVRIPPSVALRYE